MLAGCSAWITILCCHILLHVRVLKLSDGCVCTVVMGQPWTNTPYVEVEFEEDHLATYLHPFRIKNRGWWTARSGLQCPVLLHDMYFEVQFCTCLQKKLILQSARERLPLAQSIRRESKIDRGGPVTWHLYCDFDALPRGSQKERDSAVVKLPAKSERQWVYIFTLLRLNFCFGPWLSWFGSNERPLSLVSSGSGQRHRHLIR